MSEKYETFVCEYPFDGSHWGFQIKARSHEEARQRLKMMAWAEVQGELVAEIRIPGGTFLLRLWNWMRGV